jgi:hypothetical protein
MGEGKELAFFGVIRCHRSDLTTEAKLRVNLKCVLPVINQVGGDAVFVGIKGNLQDVVAFGFALDVAGHKRLVILLPKPDPNNSQQKKV